MFNNHIWISEDTNSQLFINITLVPIFSVHYDFTAKNTSSINSVNNIALFADNYDQVYNFSSILSLEHNKYQRKIFFCKFEQFFYLLFLCICYNFPLVEYLLSVWQMGKKQGSTSYLCTYVYFLWNIKIIQYICDAFWYISPFHTEDYLGSLTPWDGLLK